VKERIKAAREDDPYAAWARGISQEN
jgi:hypothetical protein